MPPMPGQTSPTSEQVPTTTGQIASMLRQTAATGCQAVPTLRTSSADALSDARDVESDVLDHPPERPDMFFGDSDLLSGEFDPLPAD